MMNYETIRDLFFRSKGLPGNLFRITKVGGVVVWVVSDATVEGSETGD